MKKIEFKVTPLNIALFIVFTIIFAFITQKITDRHRMNSMFDQAVQEQNKENFQAAVDIYKQIGVRYNNTKVAEKSLLRAAEVYYYNINNYRLAVDILKKLIKRSGYVDLLAQEKLLLARIYTEEKGNLDDAYDLLKEASRLDLSEEDQKNVFMISARVSFKMEKYEESAEYYEKALPLFEDSEEEIDVMLSLAATYTAMLDRPKAEKLFKKILERKKLSDQQRKRVEWQLFQNLDEQDRPEEALEIINSMISRDLNDDLLIEERQRIQEQIDFLRQAARHTR